MSSNKLVLLQICMINIRSYNQWFKDLSYGDISMYLQIMHIILCGKKIKDTN